MNLDRFEARLIHKPHRPRNFEINAHHVRSRLLRAGGDQLKAGRGQDEDWSCVWFFGTLILRGEMRCVWGERFVSAGRHKALTCAVFGVYCRLPNPERDFRGFAMRSSRRALSPYKFGMFYFLNPGAAGRGIDKKRAKPCSQ